MDLIIKSCLSFLGLFNLKIRKFNLTQKKASAEIEKIAEWRKGSLNKKLIWVHCASLGEFEQGRPLIDRFFDSGDYLVLISFFSSSGYDIRFNYPKAHKVTYLPLAKPRSLIKAMKPAVAIFIKYEFWPNYLKQLAFFKIPTYFVSVIIRPDHFVLGSLGFYIRRFLKNVNQVFVQDASSQQLLLRAGFKNISLSGDTRFDRVAAAAKMVQPKEKINAFKGHHKLLVAGSTWDEDIALLGKWNNHNFKMVIVPHEIKNIEALKLRLNACVYSEGIDNDKRILIIDTIGMLSSLYNEADIVYVGGAFGAGLHNILEPASHGKPIYFGNKNYVKFNEAVELIKLGVAFAISDANEIKIELLDVPTIKNEALTYVKNNTGATELVFDYIVKEITL